jgi:hypothetical protein
MNFLSHQDGRNPLCPSCNECNECTEMCKHIAQCPETGRAAAFLQLTMEVEKWMDGNGTHPVVKLLLLQYLCGRGSITCAECSDDLNLPTDSLRVCYLPGCHRVGQFFVMGMISTKLLAIQKTHFHMTGESNRATRWIAGLIT